ncbi:MAG: DUF4442 domain-containing protein [Francisellaceae bacterium]
MNSKKIRQLASRLPASVLRLLLNRYRPLRGASIKVKSIAPDFRHIRVEMPLKWHNQNYFGTQYGGSLFSMADAFYPLMLSNNLGSHYIIWDIESTIQFLKPGRKTVYCEFKLEEKDLEMIKEQTHAFGKFHWHKIVNIYDTDRLLIATIHKTIYIRDRRITIDKNRPLSH